MCYIENCKSFMLTDKIFCLYDCSGPGGADRPGWSVPTAGAWTSDSARWSQGERTSCPSGIPTPKSCWQPGELRRYLVSRMVLMVLMKLTSIHGIAHYNILAGLGGAGSVLHQCWNYLSWADQPLTRGQCSNKLEIWFDLIQKYLLSVNIIQRFSRLRINWLRNIDLDLMFTWKQMTPWKGLTQLSSSLATLNTAI